MRRTGLRLLGDVPWGRHIAFFYEGKDDLAAICVPFLQAGLESNEVCVWVVARPLTKKDAWVTLRDAIPALDGHRAAGRIDVLESQTWYITGDSPDLQKVANGWEAKLADALERGYDGLRVAASAPHLQDKDWADFLDYEDRLNGYLSDKAMLVMCVYPLASTRASDITHTHPTVIKKQRGEWKAHHKSNEPRSQKR